MLLSKEFWMLLSMFHGRLCLVCSRLTFSHRQGIAQWYYYFVSRRADVHIIENDVKSFYGVLSMGSEEAKKRFDHDMMVRVNVVTFKIPIHR
jgi:hypothetical protein